MSMKEKIAIVETLIERAEDYAKTSYELYKLKAIEKGSSIVSLLIASVVFYVVFLLFMIILSIGFSLYLGKIFGEVHYGFMAVAGFYLLVMIILIVFRKQLLLDVFANLLINSIFKEEDHASNKG
ncbi:MAG: hypothetical protein ITG00_06210 [Flavobacterium sp.]|nr:hypothetical protein [Flavobacterium sp.]